MDINLTGEEAYYIKKNKRCVGSGVDGSVYDMGNHVLYKFYHKMGDYIVIDEKGIYDSEGVNITNIKELRYKGIRENHKPINYIDDDGVILSREQAIRKAIEKQKYVKYTTLPQNIIKVNNKVAGCVYKKYDSILGIYAASFLPLELRKRVLRRLYFKLKELYENNIYPITLAQKNDLLPFSTKESNVLLCKHLNPIIIDVDGISAIYTDSFSKSKYEKSMGSFSKLVLEILSGVDIKEDDEELENTIDQLIERNIDEHIIKKFINYNRLEEKEIIRMIK